MRALACVTIMSFALTVSILGVAEAVASPELTFVLGAAPDSYIISGSGFAPDSLVDVSELPCGELRCGAEAIRSTRGVKVRPDGSFSALYSGPVAYDPLDRRDFRFIVVTPSGVTWNDSTPWIKVPLHHAGTVGPPGTGTGPSESTHEIRLVTLAGALLLSAAAATTGFGARRRLAK